MELNLCFYPDGSETPTASIHVGAVLPSRLERLYREVDLFLEDFSEIARVAQSYGDRPIFGMYDNPAPGRGIYEYDRFKAQKEWFLNEEDVLVGVLYACCIFQSYDISPEEIENSKENNKKRDSGYESSSEGIKNDKENSNRFAHGYVSHYESLEGLTVTMDYKGDKYTDITKISLVRSRLGFGGVRLVAKKNGGDPTTYYLLTKTVYYYEEFEDYSIRQSPSFGIVEADSKLRYAGNSLCFSECIYSSENVFIPHTEVTYEDRDGNLISELSNYGCAEEYGANTDQQPAGRAVSVAHLFFERNGEDYTFSVLIDGKLHKKISKTDDAVIFYSKDFTFGGKPRYRFVNSSGEKDSVLVFRNVDGVYKNEECWLSWTEKAINTNITMPSVPGGDGVTFLHTFYQDCVKALYKAFENSEVYYTTKYKWSTGQIVERWSDETRNNLGTETPPACQLDIRRTGHCMHAFPYEDTVITARASLRCDRIEDFHGVFTIPFPDFSVDSVAFSENGSTIALKPANDVLDVEIIDAETNQSFVEKFGLLSVQPDFDNTGIPSNLHLVPDWLKVKSQFYLYRRIKDAIVKFGIERCEFLLDDDDAKNREIISEILYGGERMVPDENIISTACRLKNEYKRTKRIPNIAIVGQAGTGKTTLAKNLGRIFEKDVLDITPSDLRGAYIGHTKYEVVRRLAQAAENNQILYLDEAYQLMEDRFGNEAITVLLPLMTGDQTKVEASLDRAQNDIIELDFGDAETGRKGRLKISNIKTDTIKKDMELEPGIIPIWISGYENEVRMMISQNQGLYRRLKKVVIKTPVTSDLLRRFDGVLESFAKGNDKTSRRASMLQKHFKDNDIESVKKFFAWGSEPQNSKYFASHAGVSSFVANCIDSIDFGRALGPQIEDIIISTKLDIKRQLSTVRNAGGKSKELMNAPDTLDTIHVITDIDTRFSDLIGCGSQVAFMQSIIDMLVKKSTYENYHITVPKGALMEGLPGTGKTFIASAMAGELQERFQNEAPDKRFGFMSFSASELGNKPASYIASIFSTAEEYDACVLFIDEVDAIAKHRNENRFYDRYLELIKQMDGIEKRSNVFILAATNAPENLDPAFVRSGRIDKNLEFTLPDRDSREELVRRAIRKRLNALVNFDPEGKEEDIDAVAKLAARKTLGFTAGDIDNVINNAFIAYHQFTHINDSDSSIGKGFFDSYPFINRDRLEIDFSNGKTELKNATEDKSLKEIYAFIEEEIERKYLGAPNYKKREKEFNTEKNGNCSSTAIHEVGHAVLSLMLGEKLFDIITTIPRGKTLGYVSRSELDMVTKSDYENRICVCMGGRIAEEIIYGKDNISTGAVADMRSATDIARRMVEKWGFSDEFGFMALYVSAGNYLGSSGSYTCSDAFREKSDIAVNELLKRLYGEAFGMLKDKREFIENIAKRVFDNETMTGEEFRKLYKKELELFAGK